MGLEPCEPNFADVGNQTRLCVFVRFSRTHFISFCCLFSYSNNSNIWAIYAVRFIAWPLSIKRACNVIVVYFALTLAVRLSGEHICISVEGVFYFFAS